MKKIICLAMAFVALVSCSDKTPQHFDFNPDLEKLGVTAEKIQAVDDVLQKQVDDQVVSCALGFVAQHGNVLYNKGFGYKNVEDGTPVSLDDYFLLFSMTKAVTTVAFMTLYEKGLVDIYAPVATVFPEIPDTIFDGVAEDGSYITHPAETPMNFVHLMCHASGLNAGEIKNIRLANMEKMGQKGALPQNGQHSNEGMMKCDYLSEDMRELATYPLGFDPGSDFDYHISVNMLAYMIELITGKTLREYVKETIFEPLEMNDTDWFFDESYFDRFVKLYRSDDGVLTRIPDTYSKMACGPKQTYCEGALGLNGTMGDYAKFAQMLVNGGEFNNARILKKETIDLMTQTNCLPEVNSGGDGFQFGMGFQLYLNGKNKYNEMMSNSCYRWAGAFGTEYMIDPDNDAIFVYFVNMDSRPLKPYTDWLEAAYKLIAR